MNKNIEYEKGSYIHANLGLVWITDECLKLQSNNPDATSIFVFSDYDNEIKEVSKNCLRRS